MPSRIVRKPDWEPLLAQWLGEAVNRPFEWGQFDCALAAADALTVQTGVDFAGDWRGRYSTAKGAFKQLLKKGYGDVYQAMTGALQSEPVAPERLQRGDIGGVDLPDGPTLGVIWSGGIWLPKPEGLRAYPVKLAQCGWKLPGIDGRDC